MTNEEKQLLLADLCARLPYGVKILCEGWDSDRDCEFTTVEELIGIDDRFIYTIWRDEKDKHSIKEPLSITDYKPYLRPMSSMTEKESSELESITFPLMEKDWDGNENPACIRWIDIPKYMDFILSHHFDYRGLIEKGLAIEAPEGMYGKEEIE